MEHQARPHTGAEVGRALRQVAEPVVEGEMQAAVQGGVQLIRRPIRAVELQARLHHLDAQVVFLADHQTGAFVLRKAQDAPLFPFGKLGTYQVAFHQGQSRDMRQRVHVDDPVAPLGQGL